jgi:hypothetical protein
LSIRWKGLTQSSLESLHLELGFILLLLWLTLLGLAIHIHVISVATIIRHSNYIYYGD